MPTYLSARQAAAICGVSDKTIRQWIADGKLRADRVRTAYRIDEADLADLRTQSADPAPQSAPESAPSAPTSGDGAEWSALVRDLQSQNLALAGKVGWLEAKLQEAQAENLRLTDGQPVTMNQSTPAPEATPARSQRLIRLLWPWRKVSPVG